MKLLIVDDEPLIRNVIKEYAIIEKFEVIEASNGNEAIDIVKKDNIDIIVLDIMMPKLDGYSALKQIKEIKNIPVIILSARSEEFDKLLGFELGIDDYLTKPFSPKELMARIKAIMKRFNKEIDEYIYKNLKIDFKGHVVYINNEEIKLTPKEYELLTYFIKNKNIALSRDQLLSTVWGYDFYGDDRTIDTHIKMLRNNLGEYRNLIVTIRGMGYKFETKEK
ncbi:MAG: response regulator transcription factor [Bacilli bacterium]|nr:response regulator transcription factor [Bacilli bacterium]